MSDDPESPLPGARDVKLPSIQLGFALAALSDSPNGPLSSVRMANRTLPDVPSSDFISPIDAILISRAQAPQ